MTNEPIVDEQLAAQHGLSSEEYDRIISILGRVPTYTELGIFSVMWSEHCSYKNSLRVIRTLPRQGEKLLAEPGTENAGLVDIGDNLAIAFKIESHNHPTAVEPYQGAATGVGGILRDVFTMGARPIALLNSLRFGELDNERTKYLLSHVVKGIGDYGNSFGVPTVGGEVYFDKSYQSNPLVNAMAVGLVDKKKVIHAVARGVGNPVFIAGSATGRDGIHGATFASEEISERSEDRRPSVQVGDPFTEKCLLEALLEAHEANCLVAVQDMGAAGIIGSTCEMSARGGVGMEINLDLVPVRETSMTPYEILLSESQERMLIIAHPDKTETLKKIFEKWDINATQIGTIIDKDLVRFQKDGRVVAEVPATSLAAGFGAPVYVRESRKPKYLETTERFTGMELPIPHDLGDVLLRLLASPNITSKKWIFEQYDYAVQTNSVLGPGSDAAVVRIKGTKKVIALSTDCNARYVYLSPRTGASIAVAEAARNVVAVGARPIAITNCLNFGTPYDPEIYWQFEEAVAGIGEACWALGTPVTGGNVSFYNEGPEGPIFPTPVIGMLGIADNTSSIVTPYFKDNGDLIAVIGETTGHIGGSEYLYVVHGQTAGQAPAINLDLERRTQEAILAMIHAGLLKSCHDISEGGLAVALAESCILGDPNPIGASLEISPETREDFYLFGEDQSRFLISFNSINLRSILDVVKDYKLSLQPLGQVGGDRLCLKGYVDLPLKTIHRTYFNSLQQTVEVSV